MVNDAVMEEELEDVYDLGRIRNDLQAMIDDDGITCFRHDENGTRAYMEYKRLASKLCIYPDAPPQETIGSERKKKFLYQQIRMVEDRLTKKPRNIGHLYRAGKDVEYFRTILLRSNDNADFLELPNLVYKVKQVAENLEIDINEELKQLEYYYNFDKGCLDKIKKKLCKDKRNYADPERSEIDPTRIITNDCWAISLVRLPDKSYNKYAFLVLEGKIGTKSIIWFAVFVAEDTRHASDLLQPGLRIGKMRLYDYDAVAGSSSKLLFRCETPLMKIENTDRLINSTWSIPEPTAQSLLRNIKRYQQHPPDYNISGNTGLWSRGYNTFTFAKKILRDLNDECIDIKEGTLEEWTSSKTNQSLVDNQFLKRWWTKLFLALTILVVCIAYLFLKYSQQSDISQISKLDQ